MTKMILHCAACRQNFEPLDGLFACPNARPDEEHVLRKTISAAAAFKERLTKVWDTDRQRSFEIFQELTVSRYILGKNRYLQLLDTIGNRLQNFEGKDFRVTPLVEAQDLATSMNRSGRIWVKDETGNIAGSHKGRHLMGTLLYLEALRIYKKLKQKKILSIYSCGNAALGAAAVARAGEYELHAFVPDDVEPVVADMLAERNAIVEKIPRSATGAGDPCYLAFQQSITEKGWIPFACAGNANWSNLDGGETMGWELALQLKDRGAKVSSIIIQVGGGALARSLVQSLEECLQQGIVKNLPRICVCQPEGGFPFVRAYYLVLAEIAGRNGLPFGLDYDIGSQPSAELDKLIHFSEKNSENINTVIDFIRNRFFSAGVRNVLNDLLARRRRYMWAWDGKRPHSLAQGILDDETYDWYYLLLGILKTGGKAEVLKEATIKTAHRLAYRQTGIAVCPTGAAGLAGLMQHEKSGFIDPGENVALFFTGLDRSRGA